CKRYPSDGLSVIEISDGFLVAGKDRCYNHVSTFLLKLNHAGKAEWCRKYSGPDNSRGDFGGMTEFDGTILVGIGNTLMAFDSEGRFQSQRDYTSAVVIAG